LFVVRAGRITIVILVSAIGGLSVLLVAAALGVSADIILSFVLLKIINGTPP
jgi:hypothetical protein